MRRALLLAAVLAVAAAGVGTAAPPPVRLGPLLRVQSPAAAAPLCPYESEPSTTVTSAGTWVAYNDDANCGSLLPSGPTTSLQLIPPAGPAHEVALPALPNNYRYSGDPGLAPDPRVPGGVLLSSLVNSLNGNPTTLGVVAVTPELHATLLPSPSTGTFDDKELIAADVSARSPYRGRAYVAWDDLDANAVTVRALIGGRWARPVRLPVTNGLPDVAVGPRGQVAVAVTTTSGADVFVSTDGGATFGPARRALRGQQPGRSNTDCPLVRVVARRQRVILGPRLAWDIAGALHIVGAVAGGSTAGAVVHAASADNGRTFGAQTAVASTPGQDQWAADIAPLPRGGVAVAYLQSKGTDSYAARVLLLTDGAIGRPVDLSAGEGPLPLLTEAAGHATCYGIGDYIGLAPTSTGAVAVWPTTAGVALPNADSDIAVRSLTPTR